MNDTQILNGTMYMNMIRGGAANLNKNRVAVNELNVFPVPDGDTGDNMFMTINSGAVNLENEDAPIGEISSEIAHRMLLGARGNSGVILSRIFAGIANGLAGCSDADIPTLAHALECGTDEAYKSVSSPVEGTILTVCRESVQYANSKLKDTPTLKKYFENLFTEAQNSLERTPSLLEDLAQAGVVDSGGAGFLFIVDGMKNALNNEIIPDGEASSSDQPKNIDFSLFTEDSECTYGYCTELLLRLQSAKVDVKSFDENIIGDFLNKVGDSVVLVRSGSIVKIHVHTKAPGDILNECQKYGEFLTVKTENMQLQHNGAAKPKNINLKTENIRKSFASVVCCNGKGMMDLFSSLGADYIVDGGQSMNPSTEDFLCAFDKVNADKIFVFPNNKNIIMAAKQAGSMYEKSEVYIVNTKTVGEGYAAFSMLDTSSGDATAITEELNEIASDVTTGMVCRSTKSARIDGIDIVKGDYIGIANGSIVTSTADCSDAVKALCEKVKAFESDVLIVLCGEDSKSDEADALCAHLQKKYPKTEIIMLKADQPVYDYILIFE